MMDDTEENIDPKNIKNFYTIKSNPLYMKALNDPLIRVSRNIK